MNKKLQRVLSVASLALISPAAALADINPGSVPNTTNLSVVGVINLLLNFIWPLFVGFAVLMFLLAGFYFITAQGDANKVEEARNFVVWASVGVVFGILAFSLPFVIRTSLGL